MTTGPGLLRVACADDASRVLDLWDLLFDDGGPDPDAPWRTHALAWFLRAVDQHDTTRLPVVEVDGAPVATAVATLEPGVPNPHSPRGRAVRLANLVTLPGHRRQGHGALLTRDVVAWARRIDADRVDLSATPDGQRLYAGLGFTPTSAPRMKLVL